MPTRRHQPLWRATSASALLASRTPRRLELECEAAAPKRAPEGPQIADRQPVRPRGGMIVSMDAAMVRATAGGGKRPPGRCLSRTGAVAPGGIPAKPPNRRPVGHGRRRRCLVHGGKVPSSINHLAADDRQLGRNAGNLVLGTGEIV